MPILQKPACKEKGEKEGKRFNDCNSNCFLTLYSKCNSKLFSSIVKQKFMNLKLVLTTLLLTTGVAFTSSFMKRAHPNFSGQAPQGYTGANPGQYCTACHGGASLNTAGGLVSTTGLATAGYLPSTQYNFTLTTTHGAANRLRWGFAIAAKNSAGQDVGTFSTSNPNAIVAGGELTHSNPPIQATAAASFTQTNLTWTAPVSPGPNDQVITFYYAGNAANGNGSSSGDFIYAGSATSSLVLPVTLSNFSVSKSGKSVAVKWRTEAESNTNYFAIERSEDGVRFIEIGRKPAAGSSNSPLDYSYTDDVPGLNNTTVFYRITTIDLDGKKSISTVEKIALSGFINFVSNIMPNPVRAGEEIKFTVQSDKRQQLNLFLLASDKKVLKRVRIPVVSGANIAAVKIPAAWSNAVIFSSFEMDGKKQQMPLLLAR